jgi:hypothetical protein
MWWYVQLLQPMDDIFEGVPKAHSTLCKYYLKKKQTSNSERGQNLKPPLFSIDPQKQVNSMQESEVALLREEKKQGQN